jgi:hypothetical protein
LCFLARQSVGEVLGILDEGSDLSNRFLKFVESQDITNLMFSSELPPYPMV